MASPSAEVEGIEGGEHLIEAFRQLSRFRLSGMGGPEAIQPGTVRDWCAVTGNRLSVEEIGIIFDLDAAYRIAWRKESEANEGGVENG